MRWRIARWVERADQFCHRTLKWSPRLLCDMADVSYGAPADDVNFPRATWRRPLLRRWERFLERA